EGGHPDHDACAFLAARLAGELGGRPIEQVSLYHGAGMPGRLFRAGDPLAENGPIRRLSLSPAEWRRYAAAVRLFPSQWRTWMGLWPVMFASYARQGWGCQTLAQDRVTQRPHEGPLLYERMYGAAYADVRAALDAL
ncbi:MAG TPA: hypothetical protein VIO94_05145, partial [Phenylobacterium sp.]